MAGDSLDEKTEPVEPIHPGSLPPVPPNPNPVPPPPGPPDPGRVPLYAEPAPLPPKKKSKAGCWILGFLGCFLFIVVVGIIVAGLFLVASAGMGMTSTVGESVVREGSDDKIAVIRVEGIISEGSSDSGFFATGGAYSESIIHQIETAQSDGAVKGVLIRMNTPGGEVVASDLVYRKLSALSEEKPVVTWMSGMGASGGYMIAVASDRIIAHPSTLTGSIGVILEAVSYEGLYEKLGIETRIFKSGAFKDDAGVFDEDPEGEADKIYQTLIDETYADFVTIVATGRNMEEAEVRNLADGRVYTGKQAKELGLVDDTGDFDTAVDSLEELAGLQDMTVVEYTSGGFWESLYEYQHVLLDRIGLLPDQSRFGIYQYYLLDL